MALLAANDPRVHALAEVANDAMLATRLAERERAGITLAETHNNKVTAEVLKHAQRLHRANPDVSEAALMAVLIERADALAMTEPITNN
jgi:hypothetical protein